MPKRTRVSTVLKPFHPLVREWFHESLGAPSAPQEQGWPAIASGSHTLILAPTGTGKTLTAFLWELNNLIVDGSASPLANAVHILYISPLKALNNDIQRNLERPLAELKERFAKAGEAFPEIRVAVRTGDTPASARARMIRKSPHVLITTPESLHIMLTTVRGRGMFSAVRAVIVDEIHAIAGTKRGVHLALTLERLERLCEQSPQRIGLSATQRPLEEIARFLGGCRDGDFRPVTIVDCGLVKQTEIAIESPVEDLGHLPGGTIWPSVAPLVLRHMRDSRTTIVFVNNRAQAEKMAARINALADEELALPYHGSLSRERRFLLEGALKAGKLRALVSTSSLELGIDIGSVDLVLQLQSPKRVATALQRIGRAGHTLQAVSRGVFVPTFRDDAAETLAIGRGMRSGDVEPTRVVQNALDVLAQVVVAAVAIDDDWTSADLFELVKRAYPYHALTRAAFDEVLAMLSGKYPSDVAAELEARMVWDRTTDRLTPLRSSRLVSVVNGGTIPDRGLYAVNLPDRTRLGELDEEFVHETRIGDVFQLGSSTWRVNAIEHDRVIVTPAPGAPARMPFWHGEYAARSSHLAPRVGALRRQLDQARTEDDAARIADEYECDTATAQSLVEYVHQQRAATAAVPDDKLLLIEHFRDETNAVRIVIHAPFGGRVNAPWGMALASRVREALRGSAGRRTAGTELQVQTTDDGIMLRLPDLNGPVPLDALHGLLPDEAERRVLEEIGDSSLFGARFRMNAARALLLPRGNPRRRMPLWLQRLKAQDLLQTVREFPSFPILVETYRDVLQDAFDMPALAELLRALQSGTIEMREVATAVPSPFAASLQFGFVMDWMYADDTPRAEQRAAMLSLDRGMLDELLGTAGGGADEGTLESLEQLLAIRRGTAPSRRARTADELAILLDRAGDLTVAELRERTATEGLIGDPTRELLETGRAVGMAIPLGGGATEQRVILTDAYPRYVAAFGEPAFATVGTGPELTPTTAIAAIPEALRRPTVTRGAARRELLARLVALSGPLSVEDVRGRYDLASESVAQLLDEWTKAGKLIRGNFARSSTEHGVALRWVSRRLLEQARRRELAAARRQIEAVGIETFAHFLQRWQHIDPATRLEGADGTAAALRQLYGIARPAESWERDYLRQRVSGYDAEGITRLCATGEAVWVGGASNSASDESGATLVQLRFVRRGTGRAWLANPVAGSPTLTENAERVHQALRSEGASFFDDLMRATSLSGRSTRDALKELVAAGLVSNDTMESLRHVVRWRPFVSVRMRNQPDPTRWLPADYSPAANRPVVQRRPNLRRLPKWRPPTDGRSDPGSATWPGRWSLVRTDGILGISDEESALAEVVARQWLDRYGVVTRDWWKREHPAVTWRAIYRELKRLEFRGDVRRGYFVRGLAGAQFALPSAVEMLRASGPSPTSSTDAAPRVAAAPVIVMAASDPANPYTLVASGAVEGRGVELARRRSRGALLATRAGEIILVAESRGRRLTIRPEASLADVTVAARALAQRLVQASERTRDPTIETIDGVTATVSPYAAAFQAAGFRSTSGGLRYYAPPR
jgi:ATP-dependent Lhr-like helicase